MKSEKLTTFTLETFAAYIQEENTGTVKHQAARAAQYLFSFEALQRYIRWDAVTLETRRRLLACATVQQVYDIVSNLCDGEDRDSTAVPSVTDCLVGYYLVKLKLFETPYFVGPPEGVQDRTEEIARLPRARIRAQSPEPLLHFLVFLPMSKPSHNVDNYAVHISLQHVARISANTYCVASQLTLYVVGKDDVQKARAQRESNVTEIGKGRFELDHEWIYYAGRVRIDALDFYGILTPYYGVPEPNSPNVAVRVEEGKGRVETAIRTWAGTA